MSEPNSRPIPLEYAGPPEGAETSILAGESLNKYQKLFPTTKEAATFYARFQARRFSRTSADGICKGCRAATPEIVVIAWRVGFKLRAKELSLSTDGYRALLCTCHSLCDRCLEGIRYRARRRSRTVAIGMMAACTATLLLIWSFQNPPWTLAIKRSLGLLFYLPPVAVIVGALFYLAGTQNVRHEPLPPELRK